MRNEYIVKKQLSVIIMRFYMIKYSLKVQNKKQKLIIKVYTNNDIRGVTIK